VEQETFVLLCCAAFLSVTQVSQPSLHSFEHTTAVTEEDLGFAFGAFGTVSQIALPRNKATGDSRGFAFVDLASKEEVEKAIAEMDGQELNGRSISVSPMLPKANIPVKSERAPTPEMPDLKAYIGNLPFGALEEDIKAFFTEQAPVTDVYLAKDSETGKDRGFGFVSFETEADMMKAIQALDGSFFKGRRLAVRKPLKKGEKSDVKPRSK
jgi:polyadenylate-binding protein